MGKIGQVIVERITIPFTNIQVNINPDIILMTFVAIGILILFCLIGRRNLKPIPGRKQTVVEFCVSAFDDLSKETLGKEEGRKFFPLIATLFWFVCIANWMDIIPGLEAPTRDINLTLGLAILVFFVAHVSAIKKKGVKKYMKTYFHPIFIMFPINVMGEIGKTLSHGFRLYGNVFGGGVVLAIVAPVTRDIFQSFGWPAIITLSGQSFVAFSILLVGKFFFGLVIGTIQALVFAMIALMYINVACD